MAPVLSVVVAVLVFVGIALFLSRRGLHRSLETMPLVAGERTLAEVRDLTLVFYKGGGMPSQVTYAGCIVRVTTSRLLVAQQVGTTGQNRVLSVVLPPAGEAAMRSVDAQAIDRALKSFSIGRVVAGGSTPDGGIAVSMEYLGPAVAPPNPPRWEFPPASASDLAPALREAGLAT
ncbi:MAG: hypothetical protein HY996_02275 [Micrococcales bacterium]|nr:hypothetical protein [Micrococcales bacterium]